jgi:hypothetical protein
MVGKVNRRRTCREAFRCQPTRSTPRACLSRVSSRVAYPQRKAVIGSARVGAQMTGIRGTRTRGTRTRPRANPRAGISTSVRMTGTRTRTPRRPFDHVDDEVAVALTLTRRSAGRLLALGLDRLPLTRAALASGLIDERRAEVIAEELPGLDDAHATAAERLTIAKAPGLNPGQLRALGLRLVISADPSAARRRKEQALKDARVETFTEHAGTAALAGRDLCPVDVLAADKHLTALAQAMKAAGITGTTDTLRATPTSTCCTTTDSTRQAGHTSPASVPASIASPSSSKAPTVPTTRSTLAISSCAAPLATRSSIGGATTPALARGTGQPCSAQECAG